VERALTLGLRAADHSRSSAAYELAAEQYAAVLGVLDFQGSTPELRSRVLAAVADVQTIAGRHDDAIAIFGDVDRIAGNSRLPDFVADTVVPFAEAAKRRKLRFQ